MNKANPNNLNENIDIQQYITFLIGCKYSKEEIKDINYYTKCKSIAKDFMLSKQFDISKIDFNLEEYFERGNKNGKRTD